MSNSVNSYDSLGELFRQQLENHRLPVDDYDQTGIEQRLAKKKKAGIIRFGIAGAMTAAASVTLLLLMNGPSVDTPDIAAANNPKIITNDAEYPNNEHSPTTPSEQIASNERPVEPISVSKFPERTKFDTSKTETSSRSVPIDEIQHSASESVPQNAVSQDSEDVEPVVTEISENIIDEPKIYDTLPEAEEPPQKKSNNRWLLAAAFGSGGAGGNPAEKPTFDQVAESGKSDAARLNNDYAAWASSSIQRFNGMTVDDFSEINHNVPFSFGVTARKNFGKYWGLESGLIYTYLSSSFGWSSYDVRQRLHYIGIPINVAVYLWNNNPNWKIYLSGGPMIEKGLRGVYMQKNKQGNWTHTTTVKASLDGLQWSLNSALGVSYRFDKGFGIYFEPRLSYYFDNDQPFSIRTDRPLFLGINMGLNYEF